MIDYSKIREAFNDYLSNLKGEKEEKKQALIDEFCEDEAIHIGIELNIIDIFTKMFNISCRQAQASGDIAVLEKAYLGFFDKIPANWYSTLEKCQAHGKEEEAYIEEVKINQANVIKETFLNMIK